MKSRRTAEEIRTDRKERLATKARKESASKKKAAIVAKEKRERRAANRASRPDRPSMLPVRGTTPFPLFKKTNHRPDERESNRTNLVKIGGEDASGTYQSRHDLRCMEITQGVTLTASEVSLHKYNPSALPTNQGVRSSKHPRPVRRKMRAERLEYVKSL
jgi:hypothetical protein